MTLPRQLGPARSSATESGCGPSILGSSLHASTCCKYTRCARIRFLDVVLRVHFGISNNIVGQVLVFSDDIDALHLYSGMFAFFD